MLGDGPAWNGAHHAYNLHHKPPPEAHTRSVETLTAADRCDRCGAQATVRLTHPATNWVAELLFCNHHQREHCIALLADGWVKS